MANITSDFPIPACVKFECGTGAEASDMNQVEINADAALADFKTKVVAGSTYRDLLIGYISNWWELQTGYGGPSDKQNEFPLGKHSSQRVDYVDTSIFGTNINPAYVMQRDFAFEVNAWDTQYNLLMQVYRRQYDEISNIAGGPPQQVELWNESNYPETLGATAWTINQLIRVEYHDGTSVLPLVDEANNVADIPLNVRLCSADNNIYINALNDLLVLGYTPPTTGTTRTDFIRILVINLRGNVSGSLTGVDPDSYFVTSNGTTAPNDYAGVECIHFSMGKTPC
jgi:hypothetical protein